MSQAGPQTLLTLTEARAGERLAWAQLQHPLAYAGARTEGRSLPPLACLRSRPGRRTSKITWGTTLLGPSSTREHKSQGWGWARLHKVAASVGIHEGWVWGQLH